MNPRRDVTFRYAWRAPAAQQKALRNFRQELLLRVAIGEVQDRRGADNSRRPLRADMKDWIC